MGQQTQGVRNTFYFQISFETPVNIPGGFVPHWVGDTYCDITVRARGVGCPSVSAQEQVDVLSKYADVALLEAITTKL